MNTITRQKTLKVLQSQLDSSVNFVVPAKRGYFEARYVLRPGKTIFYLSSQSGCKWGCKFCHLTETRQTDHLNAEAEDYLEQAEYILENTKVKSNQVVHWNFMARGEPLDNPYLNDKVLQNLVCAYGYYKTNNPKHRFLISTIFPRVNNIKTTLFDRFKKFEPEIYYSLYSLDSEFRKKWMPGAVEPEVALSILKEWQKRTGKIPTIHFALIAGENDSLDSADALVKEISDKRLLVKFNLIQFNPPNFRTPGSNEETIRKFGGRLASGLGSQVKIIPRVGFDVHASCGMFYND